MMKLGEFLRLRQSDIELTISIKFKPCAMSLKYVGKEIRKLAQINLAD